MVNAQQLIREVIDESIGAEEERAWMTWWANRPQGEAQSMRQYSLAQRAVLAELAKLQTCGAETTSREVQQLADRWVANLSKYRVREYLLDALTWNAALTWKWLDIGERITTRASRQESPSIMSFLRAAFKASPLGRALDTLLDDARKLLKTQASPASTQAAPLWQRLEALCRQYNLGEPETYARWTCAMGSLSDRGERVELGRADREAWDYLLAARASVMSP